MSTLSKIIKEISLDGTQNGLIRVGIIDEPYGSNSESVASIAISLQGDATEPDWKVHIPKANIDDVIEALNAIKEKI